MTLSDFHCGVVSVPLQSVRRPWDVIYFRKAFSLWFPKCIFPKCIFAKYIFAKCSRLTHLLSFASLFSPVVGGKEEIVPWFEKSNIQQGSDNVIELVWTTTSMIIWGITLKTEVVLAVVIWSTMELGLVVWRWSIQMMQLRNPFWNIFTKNCFPNQKKLKLWHSIRPLGKPFSTFSGFKILLEKSKNSNKMPFCSSGGESCKHILRFLSQALIYANLEMKCLIWSPSKMIKSTFFNVKLAAEIK